MNYQSTDVSVILPVYNGARYLGEALESIEQQTAPVGEVIIIDDGSTDDTAKIARESHIVTQYHYQPNQGPQHARNKGLQLATGKLISFLDADDLWQQNKIQRQVAIVCHYEAAIGYSRLLGYEAQPFLFLNLGSALFRSEIFEVIGNFDRTLSTIDDLDWFFRAREACVQMSVHHDVVLYHRRHKDNLTKRHAEQNQQDMLRMLHKSLQRRREQGQLIQPEFGDFRRKRSE